MNCKPGDLAVVVRSSGENLGRIVTCIRLATAAEFVSQNISTAQGEMWLLAELTLHTGGRMKPYAPDSHLRPIRDNDGEDETLTWARTPHRETA